jgi:phosphatidylserine decarboxylase
VIVSLLAGGLLALGLTLPLAWKWELGVRRVALAVGALALAASGIVAALDGALEPAGIVRTLLVAGVTLAAAFAILAYRFYRDPERTPPVTADDVVISPADGEVIYVRHSQGGRLPSSTKKGRDYELVELTKTPLRHEDAIVVGIAMSFLDVHVNRAPIAGRVRLRQHFPGRFGSLGRAEMIYENERATTVIERGDMEIAMVQIASRLVRQIASYVKVGENVALGQRVGVIRLGSQVDVVLPARPDVTVAVREGQRVRAGESVLAHLASSSADTPPSAELSSAVV